MSVIVPPNARGEVILPGQEGDPIAVGSGQWPWSVPYQDPDARGPYTVNDLVGDILYEKGGRAIIEETLERLDAPGFMRFVLMNNTAAPLRDGLGMLPSRDEAMRVFNEALADL